MKKNLQKTTLVKAIGVRLLEKNEWKFKKNKTQRCGRRAAHESSLMGESFCVSNWGGIGLIRACRRLRPGGPERAGSEERVGQAERERDRGGGEKTG